MRVSDKDMIKKDDTEFNDVDQLTHSHNKRLLQGAVPNRAVRAKIMLSSPRKPSYPGRACEKVSNAMNALNFQSPDLFTVYSGLLLSLRGLFLKLTV